MSDLTIIGGGATGMVTAYLAALAGRSVTLVEGSNNLGGLLATFETAGDPLEFYYHHFFTHDAEILWLLDRLGLQKDLLFRETAMGFYRDSTLFKFSTAFDLLRFSPLSLIDKARFAATSLYLSHRGSWRECERVSCLEWFERWAGRGVTDAIWRPMLEIKFGSYAGQVPLAWMLGRLQQRMSSRKGGREQLGYLLGSLRRLVSRLSEELASLGVKVLTGVPLSEIRVEDGRVSGVCFVDGTFRQAKDVLATVPAPVLAKLLPESCAAYRQQLQSLEYFGVVCAVVFLRRALSKIYWLNIADPGFSFGGVIEHTNFVPAERYGGEHIAYLSRYVEQDNPLLNLSDSDIADQWTEELRRIYPDLSSDDLIRVAVFRSRCAAVVCDRDFSARVPNVQTPIPGLTYAGMVHVYPDERSVNNCIRIAANYCRHRGIPHEVPEGRSIAAQIGF